MRNYIFSFFLVLFLPNFVLAQSQTLTITNPSAAKIHFEYNGNILTDSGLVNIDGGTTFQPKSLVADSPTPNTDGYYSMTMSLSDAIPSGTILSNGLHTFNIQMCFPVSNANPKAGCSNGASIQFMVQVGPIINPPPPTTNPCPCLRNISIEDGPPPTKLPVAAAVSRVKK